MMNTPIMYELAFFALNFASILASLLFYAIFGWVIANWLIMFGLITAENRLLGFLSQLVRPVLKPFRWAKIGMIDLSPIAAILMLDLAMKVFQNGLTKLMG